MTNAKPCGCITVVAPRQRATGKIVLGRVAIPLAEGRIVYCPLHSAAPALADALEGILQELASWPPESREAKVEALAEAALKTAGRRG